MKNQFTIEELEQRLEFCSCPSGFNVVSSEIIYNKETGAHVSEEYYCKKSSWHSGTTHKTVICYTDNSPCGSGKFDSISHGGSSGCLGGHSGPTYDVN